MKKYICHREGEEREKHKYIARILLKQGSGRTPNVYRYFYDQKQYHAYLKNKQNQSKKLRGIVDAKLNGLTNFIKNISSKMEEQAEQVKTTVDAILHEGEDQTKKYLNIYGDKPLKDTKDEIVNDVEKLGYDTLLFGLKDVVVSKLYETFIDVKEKIKPFEQKTESLEDVKQRVLDAETTPQEQKEREQFSDLKVKTEGYTNEEDMNLINPKYHTLTYDYSMNCSYCTAAYDMRQRGFDVEAAPINLYKDDSTNIYELASWYKDTDVKSCDEINEMLTADFPYYKDGKMVEYNPQKASDILESQLKEYGEGSRGFLCLYWANGGGHAVAWEVENGEVVIRDCQTNKVVETIDYISLSCDIDYFRTDNLELSDEIRKVVRNRK